MKKEGHWFNFELAIIKNDEEIELREVRLFAKTAREGRFVIWRDYPDADIYNHERLDVK
ncbi:hypothetical protein D3C87_81790 [compost metagenome]